MRDGSLCLCLLHVLALPVFSQSDVEKKQTISYLQSLQHASGGFLPLHAEKVQPSVRATSAAVRALKYFGGEVPDRAAAARFIAQRFDKTTGAFLDVSGAEPEVAATAVGLMAVMELKLPLADYEPGATRFLNENTKSYEQIRIAAAGFEAIGKLSPQSEVWLKEVAKLRKADGTFGSGEGLARVTGGAAACWLRLGGKLDDSEAILAALRKGQRPDGGFGDEKSNTSDLESTYRVMRAFYMLKTKPDEAKLRGFLARCRNADGGYGRIPGDPSTTAATYYVAIILHWLK